MSSPEIPGIHMFPSLLESHSEGLIEKIKYAIVFGSSESMIFITWSGDVFGVGHNVDGRLGVGNSDRQETPARVTELSGKDVVEIAAGAYDHMAASTANGELYVWGNNSYNQLADGTTTTNFVPQLCQALDGHKVSRIACGYGHSMVVTRDHKVFVWGLNDHGQCGLGDSETPQCVDSLTENRPIDVKCNTHSSFVLTANGEIYSWGLNNEGQLGIGSSENEATPQRVGGGLNIHVSALACGAEHSLVVTSNGVVFAWGCGDDGQLGSGDTDSLHIPTRVDVGKFRFAEVGASLYAHTSVARTTCGKVFLWGRCKGTPVLRPRRTLFKSFQEVSVQFSDPVVTYKPLTCEKKQGPTGVRRCLGEHFDAEEASDVDFLVEGEVVRGHVSFLRMRSPYLRALLSPTWANGQREIRVEGHSVGVFRAFLRFLYTDELCVSEESGLEEALELLRVADEYGEADMKVASEDLIWRLVSVDTVLEIYLIAIQLSAKNLENYCLDFCFKNLSAVAKSEAFMKLDLTMVRDIFLKAADANAFKY